MLLEFILFTPGVIGQGLSEPGHEDAGVYEVHDLKNNHKKLWYVSSLRKSEVCRVATRDLARKKFVEVEFFGVIH